MKNTKRFLAFLLACLFCVGSLAACSGGDDPAIDTEPQDTTAPSDSEKWPEVEGTVIYVDAAAEEGGDGSKDSPFKSVPEAQAKIREMKQGSGLPEGGITVLLASGEYSAMRTVVFTAEDSGTEDCPITYMSAEKNGAVLTAGITLSAADFEPLSDEEKAKLIDDTAKETVVKLDLSKYGLTTDDIGKIYPHGNDSRAYDYEGGVGIGSSELFINDERMSLSRYPNESSEDLFSAPFLGIGENDGEAVFKVPEEDKDAVAARAVSWETEDIWILGYLGWGWSSGILPVASIDTDEMQLTLAHKNNYGISNDGRFFFFNVFAETDAPGEYYIDRENTVLYVYPTEDFENSSIVLSVSDKEIISVSGVSYLSFNGLNISSTRASGIVITGDHITIDGCKIFGIRGNGIQANGTDITIQNNEICEIGDSAVIIEGGDKGTVSPSGNMIYNNHIHHWNQIAHSHEYAVMMTGCGTVLSHNEIHDGPHQAVIWYGPNHVMEYNEVYNVCYETSDCGAFYSGRRLDCYGSTIRYNYIHDVGSEYGQAVGIYYDDGLGGQTAYGNVIANVSWYGILACGRDNTIENNLIINCKDSPLSVTARTRSFPNNFYEHAIELAEHVAEMQKNPEWLEAFPGYGDIIPLVEGYDGDYDDPLLSSNPGNNIVRNNMCYLTYQMSPRDSEFSYQVLNMGIIENNLRFNDFDHIQIPGAESGDYTLSEDAEAYKNGFEKIPVEEIGRITEE